ncbi:MAG: CheR family methyltransferase [Nibricoccus sp.]
MQQAELTHQQFDDFSRLISERLGIKMPPAKKTMLQSRLLRRARELGMESVHDYHARFFANPDEQHEELEHLINLATTNKTDFFREPDHFDFLAQQVLPAWRTRSPGGPLKIWCAGCATGEEAYTLSMVLLEQQTRGAFDFSILATDVSTRALQRAMSATYDEEHALPIPVPLRKKYLLRGRDESAGLVKIAPEVRQHIRFGHLNFLSANYGIRDKIDVIFFRNVMIYFDRDTQREIVGRMCGILRLGGWLFTAHAETLQGLGLPLDSVASAVYVHQKEATS